VVVRKVSNLVNTEPVYNINDDKSFCNKFIKFIRHIIIISAMGPFFKSADDACNT